MTQQVSIINLFLFDCLWCDNGNCKQSTRINYDTSVVYPELISIFVVLINISVAVARISCGLVVTAVDSHPGNPTPLVTELVAKFSASLWYQEEHPGKKLFHCCHHYACYDSVDVPNVPAQFNFSFKGDNITLMLMTFCVKCVAQSLFCLFRSDVCVLSGWAKSWY